MVCWYKVSQWSHAGKHQGCRETLLFFQPTNSLGVKASSAVVLSGLLFLPLGLVLLPPFPFLLIT